MSTESPGAPKVSAFDPQYILPSILIQLTRLYEVQMLLLYKTDPEMAKKLEANHQQGVYKNPPTLRLPDNS